MRERRMSLDAVRHVSSVQSWLRQELETRGIDSMVYTRYILSILQQDSDDLEADWDEPGLVRRRGRNKRRSFDGEERKKTAAVECLLSAADEDQGIIGLVEETYRKLKEENWQDEEVTPSSGANHESNNRTVRASTPKHEKEGYYEAFPALKQPSAFSSSASTAPRTTEPALLRPRNSVWHVKRSTSPVAFRNLAETSGFVTSNVKHRRHPPRPYVYYRVSRDARAKRESKKRALKKSSPTKPIIRGEEGMKITEDILNLLKVHPENVQVRHPTIRRLTMPTADGDSEEKYMYTGPLDEIFPPKGQKLRLYERVNSSEMFASSEVLELISHDTDSVSRFLPFFVTKKRSRDSLTSDVEEARSLAQLMNQSNNNNMSPCAAEICSIETGFLQDSSDSSSSSLRNTPALISVDQAWVEDNQGEEMNGWYKTPNNVLIDAVTTDLPPLKKPPEWPKEAQQASVSLTEPLGLNLPRTVYWPVHEALNDENDLDVATATPEEVVVREPGPRFRIPSDTDLAEEDANEAKSVQPWEDAKFGQLGTACKNLTLGVKDEAEQPKTPIQPTIDREAKGSPILTEKAVPRLNEPPRPCCMDQPCLRDISPESSSTGSRSLKSPSGLEMDRNIYPENARSSESRESSDQDPLSGDSREGSSERDPVSGELCEESSEQDGEQFSNEFGCDSLDREGDLIAYESDGSGAKLLPSVFHGEFSFLKLNIGKRMVNESIDDIFDRTRETVTPAYEEPELAGLTGDDDEAAAIPDGTVSSTSRLLEIMAEAQRERLSSLSAGDVASPLTSELSVKVASTSASDAFDSATFATDDVDVTLRAEIVSDDDSSDGEEDNVCKVCHGVVCVCCDMPLSRRHQELPKLRQYDVIDALWHSDVIRLRSQDSFSSEAPYVSLIDFFDQQETSRSPDDVNASSTSADDENDVSSDRDVTSSDITPSDSPSQLSYVIDEKARVSFESHESSSASESGNEYLLKEDMAEDIDTVLAELNIPQEALAYDESDDVFSHPSFDDPLDTRAWEVGVPYQDSLEEVQYVQLKKNNTDYPQFEPAKSAQSPAEQLALDDSSHDLLWLFDLCNLHHLYAELDQDDPQALREAGAYLDGMENLLNDDNNLAKALQALAYDSEYDSIIGYLNRLLQSQFEDIDEFGDYRWNPCETRFPRRVSCGDLRQLDTAKDKVVLPSGNSAFRDTIPTKLPCDLPHSHSDSSLFMKIAPIIKVHTRSEDDAAESTELFSPETHFRPILPEAEKVRRSYDILTKPDIYNNVYPSDMTLEYQEYKDAETDFVPKFRVAETQTKALQTDIKVRKRRRAYTDGCAYTCRELLASYIKEQTVKGLPAVLPLSELCSRVVYQRNAAVLKAQPSVSRSSSPRSSESAQTMIERDDLDLEEVFATALTLRTNSEHVNQESEASNEKWPQWSSGDIWSDAGTTADIVPASQPSDWSAFLARPNGNPDPVDNYDALDDATRDYGVVNIDYANDDFNAMTSNVVGAGYEIGGEQFPPCPPGDEVPFSSELEEQWLTQGFDQTELFVDIKPRKRPRSGSWSNRPCTFFMEGTCRRADCRFSHDLSTITCRFWLKGECFKGLTCPFMHGYVRESPPCVESPPAKTSPAPSTGTSANEQVFPPCLKDQTDFPPISACMNNKSSSSSHRKLTHNQKRRSKSRSSSRDDG